MGSRLLKPEEAEEYKRLLESYHPSGQVVFDFAKSNFGIIAGPTGSGKDSIRKGLMELRPEIYRPVLSTTTRPPREGEKDGVEYHFRDVQYIDQGMEERRFLQVELVFNQQLSGLDFKDVAALDGQHYGLSIIVVQIIKKLRELNSDLRAIFVVPPTYEELINRIQSSRSMKEEEISRRMLGARAEIETALKDPDLYIVLNDDLSMAIQDADRYFLTGERSVDSESKARNSMQQILNSLSNTAS